MKKTFIILLSLFLLTGCSSDEDEVKTETNFNYNSPEGLEMLNRGDFKPPRTIIFDKTIHSYDYQGNWQIIDVLYFNEYDARYSYYDFNYKLKNGDRIEFFKDYLVINGGANIYFKTYSVFPNKYNKVWWYYRK